MLALQKIGLLGGSFNPAHAGHVHLSREAIKRLRLDAVIWLVSPANPLKEASGLAHYTTRLNKARDIAACEPRIIVSDFEQRMGLRYTVDVIRALKNHPSTIINTRKETAPHYTFLMGADNLACLHRWKGWHDIAAMLPIAIFDRAPHSHHALRSPAALALKHARLPESQARQLAMLPAPRWCYIHMPRTPLNATDLRNALGAKAFV